MKLSSFFSINCPTRISCLSDICLLLQERRHRVRSNCSDCHCPSYSHHGQGITDIVPFCQLHGFPLASSIYHPFQAWQICILQVLQRIRFRLNTSCGMTRERFEIGRQVPGLFASIFMIEDYVPLILAAVLAYPHERQRRPSWEIGGFISHVNRK